MLSRDAIADAIRNAPGDGPALVAFMTAGYPTRQHFATTLCAIANAADVIEIGVPFSDPMADGMTIQRSSRVALEQGVTLDWILAELATLKNRLAAPLLLMSYLNPLLSYGLARLPADMRRAGVAGLVVPDLPYEEGTELRAALDGQGLALVQMATPVTPPSRLVMLARESRGFVYAVTMAGTTGSEAALPDQVFEYLDRVRQIAQVPVCAGFGVRSAKQVAGLAGHTDGVIVGSALVEALERGEDPAAFLRGLRNGPR